MSNTEKSDFIFKSEAMKEVSREVDLFANTKIRILLTGERGVGKNVIARAIHNRSDRKDKPFKAVNCGGLPASLLDGELFGYVEGAFTGANQDYSGVFEQANGGTLFLDEIGLMSIETQTKLLDVVNEVSKQQVKRLGAEKLVKVDVRIIAATNINLDLLVRNGEFRLDLYERLVHHPIWVPPLRDRPGDIEPLVYHLIDKLKADHNLSESPINGIEADALDELKKRTWDGNIRVLSNVLAVALVRAARTEPQKEKIQFDDLPPEKQAVVMLADAPIEEYRNPDEQQIKYNFEATKQKLEALAKQEKLLKDVKESAIKHLAAIIVKRESKRTWREVTNICGLDLTNTKNAQTDWKHIICDLQDLLTSKEHRPQAG